MCNEKYKRLAALHVHKALSKEEEQDFLKHLGSCRGCRDGYEQIKMDIEKQLAEQDKDLDKNQIKFDIKGKDKWILGILIIIIFILIGRNFETSPVTIKDNSKDYIVIEAPDDIDHLMNQDFIEDKEEFDKYVVNYEIQIRVEELDSVIKEINKLDITTIYSTTDLDSDENNSTSISVYIDKENFDESLKTIKSLGIIILETESKEKISSKVIELSTKLQSKTNQRNKMMEYLKSVESIKDMDTIENKIFKIDEDINRIANELNQLEKVTESVKVSMDIFEYNNNTPVNLPDQTAGERISSAFNQSYESTIYFFEKIILLFANNFLQIIIILLIFLVLIFGIRKRKGGGKS